MRKQDVIQMQKNKIHSILSIDNKYWP